MKVSSNIPKQKNLHDSQLHIRAHLELRSNMIYGKGYTCKKGTPILAV